jgi:hypothetical protein
VVRGRLQRESVESGAGGELGHLFRLGLRPRRPGRCRRRYRLAGVLVTLCSLCIAGRNRNSVTKERTNKTGVPFARSRLVLLASKGCRGNSASRKRESKEAGIKSVGRASLGSNAAMRARRTNLGRLFPCYCQRQRQRQRQRRCRCRVDGRSNDNQTLRQCHDGWAGLL